MLRNTLISFARYDWPGGLKRIALFAVYCTICRGPIHCARWPGALKSPPIQAGGLATSYFPTGLPLQYRES